MKPNCKIWRVCLLSLAWLLMARMVIAHPMGNFSINHYTRLIAQADRIEGHFVLDMAEIPTVTEMSRLDANQDGVVSDAERAAYLRQMSVQLSGQLTLTINQQPVPLKVTPRDAILLPGAGGLKTLRVTLDFTADSPASSPPKIPLAVTYKDSNYPVRTGWKEIVVTGDLSTLRDSSVPATDQSKELTTYPADPTIAPPQVTEARFTWVGEEKEKRRQGTGNREQGTEGNAEHGMMNDEQNPHSSLLTHHSSLSPPSTPNTPRDQFTQSIAAVGLTPGLMGLALLSAFGFGALHALSPGHGKAMVAAYLIGTRGTARHAVLLGLVVTITHTLGVFALGLITLTASRWIVPEHLYPVISGLSGLAVAGMGAGLLWHRVGAWRSEQRQTAQDECSAQAANELDADTEEFYTQRRGASGPLSLRTLVGLGITGGALPCPSALVVMLSAIALHRIGFGLLLIVAFSLGLAVVLTILGLVVMRARGLMERVSPGAKWMPGLSVCSAAVVTLIGLLLIARSLTGRF